MEKTKMKKMMLRITILTLLTFALSVTTPMTMITFAEGGCVDGKGPDCPPDDGKGSDQGPKQPAPAPTKEVSWYCSWFRVACPAS